MKISKISLLYTLLFMTTAVYAMSEKNMNCMDAWTDPYGLMDELPTIQQIMPEVHKPHDALHEDDKLFMSTQSHLGIDGATPEDMHRLNILDREQESIHNVQGQTPIHTAVLNFDEPTVKELLRRYCLITTWEIEKFNITDRGCDKLDSQGNTPLSIAVMRLPSDPEQFAKNALIIGHLWEANADMPRKPTGVMMSLKARRMYDNWTNFVRAQGNKDEEGMKKSFDNLYNCWHNSEDIKK